MPQSNRSPPDDFQTEMILKYDKVMIQVNIFFVQKIPFQVSVMVFVSSMLFPDTGGGDVPVPSSMLFPDSGFEILRGPPPFSIR